MKHFINQCNIYFTNGYKANKYIFIILAILTKVYKRKKVNIRIKIAMVLYIVNHNKIVFKIYLFLLNTFIWFMFITKYDTEELNLVGFNGMDFNKLNKHYKNKIEYIEEYDGFDLKKSSFLKFWFLYFYYNRLYFWYTIEDEILDTTLDYNKYKYFNFDKDLQ